MRTLGIDYGDARTGLAITDALGITAQGLETVTTNGNDKILLSKLDEIMSKYEIVEKTKKFIHKLKCKYNKIKIETVDERLTTVQAHRTMNELGVKPKNKKSIVDTISAVYILETYINNQSRKPLQE